MIELTKFAARSQVGESADVLTISKNGTLRASILACEKLELDEKSYLNCYFDKNDKNYVYLEISKYDAKKSLEGYKATRTNKSNGESGIVFNLGTFLKRMGYVPDVTRIFEYEIIQISNKDYVRINITKFEEEKEEENGN